MDIKKLFNLFMVVLIGIMITSCQSESLEQKDSISIEESQDSEVTNQEKKELQRFEATFFDYFNTVTQIIIYAENEEQFEGYKKIVDQKLEYYHKLFDIYNEYEGIINVYKLNQMAMKEPIKVNPELFHFLQYCKEVVPLTNGKVNIAFGSVLKIWHDYREEGLDHPEQASLPRMEDLENANQYININDLILDEKELTVLYANDHLQLDVGAIAKGYSVQRIIDELKKAGLQSGLISAGGNVSTVGMKPEHHKWQVGIQNPNKASEDTILKVLELTDQTLVTSGDYERYYEVAGEMYHHIIDPDTLYPGKYFHQVSILTDDSGMADALSTAVFLMPFEEGKKLIESLDNVEAVWVFPDYHIEATAGILNKFVD